jgi:hypothetical protein
LKPRPRLIMAAMTMIMTTMKVSLVDRLFCH